MDMYVNTIVPMEIWQGLSWKYTETIVAVVEKYRWKSMDVKSAEGIVEECNGKTMIHGHWY